MTDHHEYCTGEFSPDDIVITGISGRFPLCNTVGELKEALMKQKYLLMETNQRYEKGAFDLPFGSAGSISDIDKFDADFFKYSSKTVDWVDPQQRMILEVSHEAIEDAGYNPCDLRGANIGVYTAISNEDGREILSMEGKAHRTMAAGYLRSMSANRCSYFFDFRGPSYTMDSACSSSFVALWSAFNDIREGRVDAALVNAGQLCLNPITTKFYLFSGIISDTLQSNPFDVRANGIIRTEAIAAFFVQRASAARRAYASIIHMKHSSSGYTPEGISVPSFKEEVKLFTDVLNETGLDPSDFQFIEAHGTGTQVGDPIECRALETVYCQEREKPLYIGSVKSSVGHSEAPAGLTGAMKTIFALESGVIAPNYGFQTPNPNCEALVKGSIKIVTEPTPLTAEYVPVNCFGFGGSFVQAILKRNNSEYASNPEPEDLPRLVLYSATTEAAILFVFEYIRSHPELRSEFFALLNKLSFTPTLLKPFRGYALFQKESPIIHIENSVQQKERQIWFVMTGMGCQWPGMGLEMMQIKAFADSMKKSAAVLKSLGIDLFELLQKDENHLLRDRNITPAFVAIAAIQIALIDVLGTLEIHPDGLIGHSTGELICAYADGCCTAEQTILSAYWRGQCVESAGLAAGAMAAVGLSWEEAVRRCPEGVYPACHNAEDSVTISGLKEPLEKFVAELQQENIFARVVNAYGYAFHCEHVWPASKLLRKALSKIMRDPKPRSERWISTSYPEDQWNTEDCRMAGTEYFVHNLMSVVRFSDMLKKIPSDAITIEIGPHFLLQSILKRSMGLDASYIGLMKRNEENNVGFFLESLGKLYVEGLNPKVENLYRPVKFPVPRGTPVISDLIKWNHSQSYDTKKWRPSTTAYEHKFAIESQDSYLLDHFVDGRALFPATGYVFLAWKALSKSLGRKSEDVNVVIEDFKIHRPTILSSGIISFKIKILDCSGTFEVVEGTSLVASGKVYENNNIVFCKPSPTINKDSSTFVTGEDIYNELKIQGYEYGPDFRRLVETSFDGKEGFVEWKDNWITFMDALLLFYMFSGDNSSFSLPTGALSFKICPKMLKSAIDESLKNGLPGLPVNFHAESKICRTVGVEIRSLEIDAVPQHVKYDNCIFEEYKFVPYIHKYEFSRKDDKLKNYMIACDKVINLLESNLKLDLSSSKFCVDHKIDFDADAYINDASEEHVLLQALKQLADSEKDSLPENKDILNKFIESISEDMINTMLVNDYCLRFVFDIIMENSFRKLNILEINNNFVSILPTVVDVIEKNSMITFKNKTLCCRDIKKVDSQQIKENNISLSTYEYLKTMVQERRQDIVISNICLSEIEEARQHLRLIASVAEQKGFIVLFHKSSILPPENLLRTISGKEISIVPHTVLESWFHEEDLTVVSKIFNDVGGIMYLIRKTAKTMPRKIIRVSENTPWLDELKTSVLNETEISWVVSEDCLSSGIVGMINCIRREVGGDRIRCVFIPERNKEENKPPLFNFDDEFYYDLLKKDLLMNVYKNNNWGSFRHIRLEKELQQEEVHHSYVNMKRQGDLSTLTWVESDLKYKGVEDSHFMHVYYSALNFRDIMLATGKISVQTAKENAGTDDIAVLGLEFSGRNRYGERIAGICASMGIATATEAIPELIVPVPDEWSLEEAATVPVVYFTCYYALIVRAGLQPGESILIHSGTGGIGQAAINIAISMNCEIYTTVGTDQKREYLLKKFPSIKNENIGCSRDTSFENMIMERTSGKGVKVVLNSLADEKFHASIRCLALHGRFVEIGKYDLALDHKIGLKFFLKNVSFHAVFLDQVLENSLMRSIQQLLMDGIKQGIVKPLDRTVFQHHEVEKAFRYMAGGTHMGKVLLKIRDEENERFSIPTIMRRPAVPVTYFYSHKVYIIVGGLGGFGIEVSKWLLQKRARNLVLTTRYGARTSYHHFCLKRWKDQGYNVIVSTRDVSIKDEASRLLKEAAEIGPVGGIFNSAVVLHDAFLENTNLESFKEVCAPKAEATRNLDSLSRCLCPELDHFVCFSSISCGLGNAGQMNYGYANSVMERICEQRRADGFPGLAIQWGIIGDVGVVHRHMGDDAMIAGVVAQRVKSCLEILDVSCRMKHPVVASYVTRHSSNKPGDIGDVLQQLARIFGLKELSDFNNVRSFGEMGIDSMLGIEVKNLLESTCNVTLTIQEIQEMKLDDVKALVEKRESEKVEAASTCLVSTTCVNLPKSFIHSKAIEKLNDIETGVPVFIIDIDCSDVSQLRSLGGDIRHPVFALLFSKEAPATDIAILASWYLEKIMDITQKEAHIVARSSASVLALEMALQNQKSEKLSLTLTIMSGYHYLLKVADQENKSSEVDILCHFVEDYIPSARNRLKEQLHELTSFEQQVRTVVDFFTKCSTEVVNKDEMTEVITSNVKKLQLLEDYAPTEKLCGDLLIMEDSSKLLANDIAEVKTLLSEICSGKVTIQRIPDMSTYNEDSIQKIASALNSVF